MENLAIDMNDEAIDQLGRIVATKIKEKSPEERPELVKKVFDAVYATKDDKFERLIGFLRNTHEDIDEETRSTLKLHIQQICQQANIDSNNKAESIVCSTNPTNSNVVSEIETVASAPQLHPRNGLDINGTIGRNVRILVGLHYGMMAKVADLKHNMIIVQFADGKTIKYLKKHLEFL